jgi:uncharacterized protein (DUF1330 family)
MNRLALTVMICLSFVFRSALAGSPPAHGPKAYVVLDITVHDPAMYEKYRQAVEPVIGQYGGRYVVRSGARFFDNDPNSEVTSAEGQWYPDRVIVLEFESRAAIQKFVNSPEYKEIVHLRLDSASARSVVVN